jgi:nucleotide-binding universal stress UspA family protein
MDTNASHGDRPREVPAGKGEHMVATDASVMETVGAEAPAADAGGTWVVGLDGSDCATNALEWAAANVAGRATAISLVSAWQTPVVGAYPMSSPTVVPFDETELHDAVAHDVADVAIAIGERVTVPVTASVGHGGPAQVLLEASESAAALVIGSRGRGGFTRLLLGSTSTQCATHASAPTIVVPGDAEPGRAERVLVGCDGSPNSMVALRWAVDFAGPGGTVVVLWVWDATPLAVGADAFFFPDASDLAAERFHHLVDTVADQARARGVTLEREFVRGTPRAALAAHADEVDLVVVGARGHGAVGAALLGSVSTWVLHHVHRPIAVVPIEH